MHATTHLPMVEMEGISKRYELGTPGAGTMRGAVENLFRRLRGTSQAPDARLGARAADRPNSFWSLRDVSLRVQPGEVVGLVGRNGAGKSTLLKILSRITEPTCG